MKKTLDKVVLITGVSSGIGLATAKRFVAEGAKVYGIGRREMSIDGVAYFQSDVRDEDRINEIVKDIVAKEGRIDILISNAGMGISGPVENATIDEIKKIMDVNFLGSVIAVKAVLPYMRERGCGRIVCVSSMGSLVALPFQSFYTASKTALDGFVDGLRSEIKMFGVQAICVHPGDVKTGFTSAREKGAIDPNNPYAELCERAVGHMERDEQSGMTSEYAGDKLYKIATRRRIKLRNVIGSKYKLFNFLLNLMPRKMREWAVRKMYF